MDFPLNPAINDTVTLEGITYIWDGVAWVILSNGGSTGQPVTIVEAEAADGSGWQVWGDTLIQWGAASGSGMRTVTFPKAFKNTPRVSLSVNNGTTNGQALADLRLVNLNLNSVSPTGFQCFVVRPDNAGTSGVANDWIAVGEAPDDLKQPKTIIGAGGVTEFHDPTMACSWRITGETLEMWGLTNNVDTVKTVVFAKHYAAADYIANANVQSSSARYANPNQLTTTGMQVSVWNGTGDPNTNVAHWRTIGKWDGIS